jgi:outer membrane lipoprotein SlyB
MNLTRLVFEALILALLLCGCSNSFSKADAEGALSKLVQSQSDGKIVVVKFKKLDTEKTELFGPLYIMRYTADLQFKETGTWLSRDPSNPIPLRFAFRTATAPTDSTGSATDTMIGHVKVRAGDRATVTGSVAGGKIDERWMLDVSEADGLIVSKLNPR